MSAKQKELVVWEDMTSRVKSVSSITGFILLEMHTPK